MGFWNKNQKFRSSVIWLSILHPIFLDFNWVLQILPSDFVFGSPDFGDYFASSFRFRMNGSPLYFTVRFSLCIGRPYGSLSIRRTSNFALICWFFRFMHFFFRYKMNVLIGGPLYLTLRFFFRVWPGKAQQ